MLPYRLAAERVQVKHSNILSTIGRTPVVRINRLAPSHVELYVKLEYFNPMGSVKDRMALAVIEAAERSGSLRPGQTIIEATSGNTGIALAMACAAKGYPLVIVMAENFSVERRKLMRFLGARVVLTPASAKASGMRAKARELAQRHGWFLANQFEHEANAEVHERTTALEILEDFREHPLTHWVSGSGTGGTLLGVARTLKRKSPLTKVVVCEPSNYPVLSEEGRHARNGQGPTEGSLPTFRPHPMQGWSPDFLPRLTETAEREGLIDVVRPVTGAAAIRMARDLARKEGIFTGISGGATVAGAIELAAELQPGSRLLAMVPDTGERYLSTPLFSDVEADMDEQEWSISRSTEGARFDVTQGGAAVEQESPGEVTPWARKFVDDLVRDSQEQVTMFSLEWCEFCWSLRRFFRQINLNYRSIDLDLPEWRQDNLAAQIRSALAARTNQPTIPQVFIGGKPYGGCMDTLTRWKEGDMQRHLDDLGIDFRRDVSREVSAFLPAWLQSRKGS